jgi:hypothetical protein
VLIWAGVALAAMLLLSASLNRVELSSGQPFALPFNPQLQPIPMNDVPGGAALLWLIRAVYFVALALTPVLVIWLIISPRARRDFLRLLMSFLPFILLFYFISTGLARMMNATKFEMGDAAREGIGDIAAIPPAEFVANPSPWLVWGVSLALGLLLAGVMALIVWRAWQRSRREQLPLIQLGQEAQEALDALQAGGDLRDVVIRCYLHMSRVVGEQRGIQRNLDMTPREFEDCLCEHGLPAEAVRQLTRLFEQVRYGAYQPAQRDERQARACLGAIVEFCAGAI